MQGITKIINGARSAEFSDDMLYRYCLTIELDRGMVGDCVFVMLNPSTADHMKNDPTVSRCMKFAQRWGYRSLSVVNIFAFRATDPRDMKKQIDPIGERNTEFILRECTKLGARVIAAWGRHGSFENRDSRVINMLKKNHVSAWCLRKTKDGVPMHPLARGKNFIPYDVQIERIDR